MNLPFVVVEKESYICFSSFEKKTIGKTESTRKWANAITDDGSMWVWIPRYAYRITSGYNSSTTGIIEIEFMKGTTNDYASTQGAEASTTGTVYGIYDMSGGSYEYVAAYVNNTYTQLGGSRYSTTYGKALIDGASYTKNVYSVGNSDSNTNNYTANSNKYGDANSGRSFRPALIAN